LGFVHPRTKREVEFVCPMPEDLDRFIEEQGKIKGS
jgi:hypothetical protein